MTTAGKRSPRARTNVERADVAVARVAAPYRDTLAIRIVGRISEIGDQPPLRVLCAATWLIGFVRGDARLRRTAVRMLAAHQLATSIKSVIKHSVDRTRPALLMDEGRYEMAPGDSHDHDLTSFPSGHTAGALAVARAFAREYPEHTVPAYTAAGMIAAAQVPRGAHYPTDLAAGAVIGIAAEAALQLTPLRTED